MTTEAAMSPAFSMSLQFDPFGRIDKVAKPRRQLQPLFEALNNSIFSVRRHQAINPTIRILVDRDEKQKRTAESEASTSIVRFTVEDNGEGFTDDNCESFRNTDSRHKKQYGGKGIGRLLWLKTFEYVEISSIVKVDGTHFERSFIFRKPEAGTSFFHNVAQNASASSATPLTRVSLISPLTPIRKSSDELAFEIISHFLTVFTSQPPVAFVLHDNSNDHTINLNQLFASDVQVAEKETTITLDDFDFSIRHCLMSSKAATRHSLFLCGEGLPVIETAAGGLLRIPNSAIATDDDRSVFYSGYISSSLLDDRNNQERHGFDLPTKDQVLLANEPTVEAIQRAAAKEARKFLTPHLKDFKQQNLKRVTGYIAANPGYRHLLAQERASLEMIPASTTDKQLDLLLYKVDKKNEVKERTRAAKLLATIQRRRPDVDTQKLLRQVNRLLADVNEASRSRLAEYVIRRRVTLQFLEDILGPTDDSPISLEDAVHNLIFPMRTTSEEIRLDETNLWIIDERFAYHRFLSSDKVAFRSASPIAVIDNGNTQRRLRHDIVIGFSREDVFDCAIASTSDALTVDTLAIVEFKKPQRNDYTSAKNPIQQTTEYARDIRRRLIYNYRKQRIEIPKDQPIFCYMICDLTPSLVEIADDRGFTPSPGGDGYFFINSSLNMFQSIVSYRKLLIDAKKRNDALFDRLHIRSEIGSTSSNAV